MLQTCGARYPSVTSPPMCPETQSLQRGNSPPGTTGLKLGLTMGSCQQPLWKTSSGGLGVGGGAPDPVAPPQAGQPPPLGTRQPELLLCLDFGRPRDHGQVSAL